jgi:hypothetical protein
MRQPVGVKHALVFRQFSEDRLTKRHDKSVIAVASSGHFICHMSLHLAQI